jgi:FMN phosphatase YigB (HAD superfamily)
MKIKHIFFDFDGVIAESVNVKTQAFYDLYIQYGKDIAKKVVHHHINNGGMSRFEKFKIYHKEFLNIELSNEEVNKLSADFSELTIDGVVASPYVPGAFEFIKNYYLKFNFWIISGTAHEDMRLITKKRGLNEYFKDVYGSPKSKSFWVKQIIDEYGINPDESIFLGDAMADYDAAINNNTKFALREHHENLELFKDIDVHRFSDFNNFYSLLESVE